MVPLQWKVRLGPVALSVEQKYASQIVQFSASAKWKGMSARCRWPRVRTLPLASTQESSLPLFHAVCWSFQECARSPLHCARRSGSAPPAGLVELNAQGYCRPRPLGWLKTL